MGGCERVAEPGNQRREEGSKSDRLEEAVDGEREDEKRGTKRKRERRGGEERARNEAAIGGKRKRRGKE